jgi:hypothetical protein
MADQIREGEEMSEQKTARGLNGGEKREIDKATRTEVPENMTAMKTSQDVPRAGKASCPFATPRF